MPAAPTILFTFRQIPAIGEMLGARGIAIAPLLAAAELPASAATGEVTAPLTRIQAFVDACADALGTPIFGLELAEHVDRGAYGLLEFVVRASPTVQDGLNALCELAPLLNPLNEMRYIADAVGCEVHFAYGGLRDALGAHLNEYTIAFTAKAFASALDRPLPLERAWFAHGRRAGVDDVARALGCPVTFQAADSGFAVTADVTLHRPASADPQLFAFLLAQARTQLANIGVTNVTAQLTRAIEARLAVADLTVESLADAMGTTARSLQRHLSDAGTTLREVLAQVRRRRRAELARTSLSDAEIATRLGFASVKTMKRSLDE